MVSLAKDGPRDDVCLDSGCIMTLIGWEYLQQMAPKSRIQKLGTPISIRGVGVATDLTDKYTIIDLYVDGQTVNGPKIAHLKRVAHIVDNLKAKLLISVDILAPEGMLVDFANKTMTMGSCQRLRTLIKLKPKSNERVRQTIKSEKRIVVLPQSSAKVPIKL